MRRLSRLLLASLCALVVSQAGCATGLFGASHPDREQAIRECTQEVPADAVPYADTFSACMEERGWTYSGTVGPRQ